jgi:Uma2 family endonuclease
VNQLSYDDKFTPAVELTLNASQLDLSQFCLKASVELKPDLCLYPNNVGYSKPRDILKMSDMPLRAIEIRIPTQSVDDLIAKIQAYFALGIQSCWLVMPTLESIIVYASITDFKHFDPKRDIEVIIEVIDEVLDIRMPLKKFF